MLWIESGKYEKEEKSRLRTGKQKSAFFFFSGGVFGFYFFVFFWNYNIQQISIVEMHQFREVIPTQQKKKQSYKIMVKIDVEI